MRVSQLVCTNLELFASLGADVGFERRHVVRELDGFACCRIDGATLLIQDQRGWSAHTNIYN